MKRIIGLVLAVIMILSTVTFVHAWEYPYEQVELKATVITCRYIESTDKFSFCAVGDVYGNGNREPFTFGISRENIKLSDEFNLDLNGGLSMGRVITVVFNGEVMESYPMQIVADMVFVEDEVEELSNDEKLSYLSMFYTEEWLIENGYMDVPLADGEEAPDENYTDSFVPDYDTEEYDSLDYEYSYVYGTPKEGDDAGKCVMLTKHYLDGFVVMADILYNDADDGSRGYASLYFFAHSNFGDEMITPVRIDFDEDSIGMLGLGFSDLAEGMNLRIYCDYGAYCVPIEGEKYYRIDGEVLTIEKLEGQTDNCAEYSSLFFNEAQDEIGYMVITDKFLEGFVVASEFSMPVDDGSAGANVTYGLVYFFAEDDFNRKIVNPIILEIDDQSVFCNDIDFWEIESGVRLRVYCSIGASCVPEEGQIYNKLKGNVVSIQKLEGYQDDYADYSKYFWGDESVIAQEPTDGGALLSAPENEAKPQSDSDSPASEPAEEKSDTTLLWIIGCSAIIAIAVTAIVVIIKTK